MNHLDQQKSHELNCVEGLIGVCPDLQGGLLSVCEAPDFKLVLRDGRKVGVECLDFVVDQGRQGSPVRRQEALRRKVLTRAQKLVDENSATSLWVTVYWRPDLHLVPSDVLPLAQQLASFVSKGMPQAPGGKASFLGDQVGKLFGGRVLEIDIHRLKGLTASYWDEPTVGFIGVDAGELQRTIALKNDLVASYLENCEPCDALWLVICIEGGLVSQTAEFYPGVLAQDFASPFDKVFVYDCGTRDWAQLKLSEN